MRRLAFGVAVMLVTGASLTAMAQSKPATTATSAAADGGASAPTAAGATGGTSATAAPAAAGADGGAPTAAPSASVAVPIPEKPAMDGATYAVRLRDLESRVDELKDQIRRSHTRLALLSDTILSGGAAGSRSEVVFHNEMTSAFKLVQAVFVVDGVVQYNKQDETGQLADQKEIPIFSGSVPPGDHTVQVSLTFQGNGYGVFTYLRGYRFQVRDAHSFTAVEGKTLSVIATAFEKGGVTTPLEQRPSVGWQEKVAGITSGAPPAGGAAAPKADANVQAGGGSASGSVSIGGGK